MGTNFYWTLPETTAVLTPFGKRVESYVDMDDPAIHIGKRSAAGKFCWDCNETLCIGGTAKIHFSVSKWHDKCPKCGSTVSEDPMRTGPVDVELGFCKPREKRPTGVRGCSSFSWVQDPVAVRKVCEDRPDEVLIESEYGDKMTCREFIDMLDANCPIEFTTYVGERFS